MTFKEFAYHKIIPAINALLKCVSLKLTTRQTPNRNFTEFFKHLDRLGFRFKTVIDVGVGNGTESLYRGTSGARYHLIEAVPDTHGTVKSIAARLNADFHNVAAGDTDGEVQFFQHADVTGSSLLKQLECDTRINGELISVPMRRLDTLLKMPIERPCLLKVDTQGAELSVLKGAEGLLDKIDLILLEVSFHQFREGAPEIGDVMEYMKKIGYVPYEILEGHYRSLDNALAQVDIAFVKSDSLLRENKTFFSPTQVAEYLSSGKV